MKCRRQDNIEKLGVSTGAVLIVQVDSIVLIDHWHLIGVIADVKITSGVLVICESGILCAMNAMNEDWIPVGR